MSSKNSVIHTVRKIVGEANVLTEVEDLYVYSFEHFFNERKRSPRFDAVVRPASDDQAVEVLELAREEEIQVFKRSTGSIGALQAKPTVTVLIDDVAMPQLDKSQKMEEKEQLKTICQEEMKRAEYGSFRNYAFALKSFFSDLPAQKCLDCEVCSGYCTVASSFSGVETWSSKGRTLLTRGLSSGELHPSPKLVNVLYTCSLCGLCFANCFESTQVRKAIMDTRHRLAKNGYAPESFAATAKNILEVGDPGRIPPNQRVAWTERLPQRKVFSKKANVLFFVGCTTSTRTPNTAVAFDKLLTAAEVDFTTLGEREGCCGYVLLATGLWKEAKQNALELVERVKATKAETLVTTCSGCYYAFKSLYPEMLNVELPCHVLHSTQYVEELLKEKRITLHDLNMKITYHDPCSLGRHSNVYQPPRNIMKAVHNLDLIETRLTRNRSRCCGAGGGLWSFNNSVATKSAVEKLVKDVTPLGVSALVTACPTCYINFRNASMRNSLGIRVYDVMEIMEFAADAGLKG